MAALWGAVAVALGLLISIYLVLAPRPAQIPSERRRPATMAPDSVLSRAASGATALIARLLARKGKLTGASALERAGVQMRTQDFVFLVLVSAVVTAAIGLLVGGPVLAVLLVVAVPIGAKVWLGLRAGRRQAAFADQLEDSLQLISSSLRAGHSLMQALASVAREAEQPTSEEFSRVLNETRLGRDPNQALEETAQRMGSEDFLWVTQAIAINREVGGNLAEVLDGVGNTIRERNQIRRQVQALAAEGKLSAYILMALPFGVVGFLVMTNGEYLMAFTEGLIGYGMIGMSLILLIVGGLWMRKLVALKF